MIANFSNGFSQNKDSIYYSHYMEEDIMEDRSYDLNRNSSYFLVLWTFP